MNFHQKKGKNEIKFLFNEDHFEYFIKDESSKGQFKLPYGIISRNKYELIEKNDTFKNNAIYLLIVSIIFTTATFVFRIPTYYFLFIIATFIMYILYLKSKTKYTVIETEDRKIYIIQDKNHDEIMRQLYTRRNELLKKMYGKINLTNNPEAEVKRFKFLLEEEVISTKEFEDIKSQIFDAAQEKN